MVAAASRCSCALGAEAAHNAPYVVRVLTSCNLETIAAAVAAGCVPPLIALLAAPSVGAQENAACALGNLRHGNEKTVAIGSAGAIPPLIAPLGSPSVGVQENALALGKYGQESSMQGRNRVGRWHPPLIALLRSPPADVQAGTMLRTHCGP